MKFIYQFLFLLLVCAPVSAQLKAHKTTKFGDPKSGDQFMSKETFEKVFDQRANDYIITAQHTSRVSNITHTYLRQAINGIEVMGTESSIHRYPNGKTLVTHVKFLENIESTAKNRTPSIDAASAIRSVASQMGYRIDNLQELQRTSSTKILFNKAGISVTDIPTQLIYYYTEEGGSRLVWELSVEELNSSDWWNFFVDAQTGNIIHKYNFTVSCFGEMEGDHSGHNHEDDTIEKIEKENTKKFTPRLNYNVPTETEMLSGTYNVFPLPIESPGHASPVNTRTSVSFPHNTTASPFGWHDTNGVAGAESNYTIGNNTDAYDDSASTVSGTGSGTNATRAFGGAGLNFNFSFNPVYSPGSDTNRSIDAAVTNLFYWANVIHDVIYLYGFDEASGNFQVNNYGNGGVAGDSVRSEAQDGSGTCNANFATPVDGGRGRMQMYVCGSRDGDFDNGVIVHEYGHGISTRLTGGAGNSGCLQNQEQMGEGWSDYYGLVMTIEPGDLGTDSRGIGTWLVGQAPNGPGIRSQPYDTDTNTYSYNSIQSESIPHGVGSVWAMMLWDMTWDLIDVYGFDPDIYNGTGGNNIAMTLVTEGLKLQPCSPGFVDGRNAILAADQAIYGGANQCLIWEAFAARGLGFSASQGSTASRSDGVEAYDLPPGTGSFAASSTDVCITQGVQTGLGGGSPSGGVYSGPGVTDDGNGTTFTFDPSVAGVGNATVTYSVADACAGGGGNSNYNDTITVTSGIPNVVCEDITVTLDGTGNASITWPDVVSNSIPGGYVYDDSNGTLPYAPFTLTGGATSVSLGDDNGTGAIAIGFDYEFYGVTYSNFYIASNGFVSFTGNGMTGAVSRTPQTLPNTGVPNGIIAGAWGDLDPSAGGTIRHQLFGTAPNRTRVIEFNAVRFWNATQTVTFQIHIKEGTNAAQVHLGDIQTNGTARTNGIENATGTEADFNAVANNGNWTANNFAIGFTPAPDTFAENCGNTVNLSLSQSSFDCSDVGVNTVIITADDGNGGVSTCTAEVTVVGETTTLSGGIWSNGLPDLGKNARFSQNYNTSTANIEACTCEVDANRIVTVAANTFMNITGNITNNGTIIVEHQGSIVQTEDDANVTNNGTINVNVTSPVLRKRDFMVMGSPMTTEDRNGVWDSAFLVLNFNPQDFVPHPDVPAGGTNFADDNGDFYTPYSGTVNAGEGYVVRPQSGYNDPTVPPAGRTFDFIYELGTLNNGVVTYTNFNTGPVVNPNGTPNVVANPYPSAISANDFMALNSGINALYFWEHLTPPGAPLNNSNLRFDMDDISIYNGAMGIPAANDGGGTTAPNGVISTAQGFGVRTFGAAGTTGTITFNNSMRLTTGNTTLRNPDARNIEKAILQVREATYGYGSFAGIAFADNATNGLDDTMDTNRLGTIVSLYSQIEGLQEELAIQTRAPFTIETKIPFGFTSQIEEDLSYEISLHSFEGLNLEAEGIFLIDNYRSTIVNLKEENYTFRSGKGNFKDRFTVLFERTQILNNNEANLNAISIYPNPAGNQINIFTPQASIEEVVFYDIQGRKVIEVQGNSNNQTQINIAHLNASVYFVKIKTNIGEVTKRLIKK